MALVEYYKRTKFGDEVLKYVEDRAKEEGRTFDEMAEIIAKECEKHE